MRKIFMNKRKKDSIPTWAKLGKENNKNHKETGKRNNYKSKLEIYYDILKIINDGNEKHKEILSITKIDRSSLDNFLDALFERKLLLKKGKEEDIKYNITDKGKKFVLNISKALKLINL
jgi:predicted transcriptional regulator